MAQEECSSKEYINALRYLGIFGSLVPVHTQQKLYNAHSLDPADNRRGGGGMGACGHQPKQEEVSRLDANQGSHTVGNNSFSTYKLRLSSAF